MNKRYQSGKWVFEAVQYRARKVKKYGEDFSGVGSITICGDTAYVDGVLRVDGSPLDRDDLNDLKTFLSELGTKYIKFCRYKSNDYDEMEEKHKLVEI